MFISIIVENMTDTEPHTPPKRVLLIDRSGEGREKAPIIFNFSNGQSDITLVHSKEKAERFLRESKDSPYDWVIVRKNIGEKSGEFNDRETDLGVKILERLHAGEYGDYAQSRIALVTNARAEVDNVALGLDHRYAENAARLYRNLSEFPNVDCVAPDNFSIYAKDVCRSPEPSVWTLPSLEELQALQPAPSARGVVANSVEILETNASNISR